MNMDRNEVIFADLPALVREKGSITENFTEKNRWRKIAYSTPKAEGHMLVTCDCDYPEDLTVPLGLTGKWLVYVSVLGISNLESRLYVKLSSHPCWTEVQYSAHGQPRCWQLVEYAKEMLVFQGDLTGEDFMISRPKNDFPGSVAILWVRCVPVPEKEPLLDFTVPENRTMQLHFDPDITWYHNFTEGTQFSLLHYAARECDGELITQEVHPGRMEDLNCDEVMMRGIQNRKIAHDRNFLPVREEYERTNLRLARENGYRLYAGFRVCESELCLPFRSPEKNHFATENAACNMRWRDGTEISILSYAYPEVRRHIIEKILPYAQKGYDGVTLLMHRGMYVGFEQPVQELFRKLYPQAGDPNVLPLEDVRLRHCRCYFVTEFMKELHQAISQIAREQNRSIGINVISDYSVETAVNMGLNLPEWAKLGLITELTQGDMEIYEDLTDCLREDGQAIDLEKYRIENTCRQVLCRNYGTNPEKVLAGLPQYLELEEKYGVKVYAILPWMQSRDGADLAKIAAKLYQAGAKRLASFNCCATIPYVDEWNVRKRLGHKNDLGRLEKDEIHLRNFYRLMSIDHVDISLASPNWKG